MISNFFSKRKAAGKASDQQEVVLRLDYLDGIHRVRSTSLLFVGSFMGFLGFAFAAFLGFWKQIEEASHSNFRGDAIGTYFPATVSEMVWDKNSGAGKCFFAFVLVGGVCMLLSWYPWALRNVYIGDDCTLFAGYLGNDRITGKPRGIRVLMLRQFLPPIGIMLVACIPAPPAANREFTDKVSTAIHTLGAVMSIGGYAFIEMFTLLKLPETCFDVAPVVFGKQPNAIREKDVRFALMVGCLVSICIFGGAGAVLGHASSIGLCCDDVWEVPSPSDWNGLNGTKLGFRVEDEVAAAHHTKMLLQVSSGTFKVLKLMEYWFEVFAGLFMLASHLTIWWYCFERHVDLEEKLPDPEMTGYKRLSGDGR